MDKLHEHVEQALHAHYRFRRDQHYMVDRRARSSSSTSSPAGPCPTGTGAKGCTRPSRPRKACRSTSPREHAAQITFQSYFRLYKKLCGHDRHRGAEPLGDAPGLQDLGGAACRPTGPCIRKHWPDRVFPTEDAKFDAMVEEVTALQQAGPGGADRHALGGQVGEAEQRV